MRCDTHFATYMARRARENAWNWPRKGVAKGQLCGHYGSLDELFMFALAKLPYIITTSLHTERAVTLWEKTGCPGLVSRPKSCDGFGLTDLFNHQRHFIVREKQFCRFVQQNWLAILSTKTEMNQAEYECQRQMMSDYENDLDDLFGRNVEDELGAMSRSHEIESGWVSEDMSYF